MQSNETPKLRGKTLAVYTRYRADQGPIVLADCLLETRGERLFLVGSGISARLGAKEWTDGVRRSIAWDAVEEYMIFESNEDYYQRAAATPATDFNQPMIEYPESEEGHPVEGSGIAIQPETPLEVGSIVLSFSQDRWWRAEVVALEDNDMVRIHYPGWDSKWDVSIPKTELQVYLGQSLEAGD
jgi:hypothetical protein